MLENQIPQSEEQRAGSGFENHFDRGHLVASGLVQHVVVGGVLEIRPYNMNWKAVQTREK